MSNTTIKTRQMTLAGKTTHEELIADMIRSYNDELMDGGNQWLRLVDADGSVWNF